MCVSNLIFLPPTFMKICMIFVPLLFPGRKVRPRFYRVDAPDWSARAARHLRYSYGYNNKKLSYCWETVRRESMPRIAEMDVEMTT